MFHVFNRTALASAALCLLTLTACGGGGGGGSSSSAPQTSNLSGVASKGLILNGLATAYAVNGDGTRGAALASVPTDASTGAYRFTGLPSGVPVLVEVGRRPGQTTQMKDEATGNTLVLDDTFKLRAATVTGNGGEVALQVTPYSEMAVALAVASGGLSADNVQKANQKVVGFAGEDVLSIPPTFDSTGKPTNPAAVKLAAVSELAKSQSASVGCSGSTQFDKVKCVVGKMASSGPSDDTLATAVGDATATVKATVPPELQARVQPVTKQLEGLPSGPVLSAIGSAKALFTSFRNLGTSLANKDAGSISSRLTRLDAEVSSLPDVMPSSLIDEIDMVSRALQAFNRTPSAAPGTVVDAGAGVVCRRATSASFDCRSVLQSLSVSPSGVYTVLQYRAVLTAGTGGSINVSTSLVTQEVNFVSEGVGIVWSAQPTSGPVAGTFTAVGQGDGTGTVFSGDLAPGLSYVHGNGGGTVVPQGAKASVSLSVTVTPGTTADRYVPTGFVKQFEALGDTTPYASATILAGSYLDEQNVYPTNDIAVRLAVDATVRNAKVNGVFETGRYLPRARNNLPGKATFTGTIVDLSDNTKLFEGSVTGDNLINPSTGDAVKTGRTGKLSLTLYMPNLRRNVTLNVNEITETAVGEYSFSGSFVDGGTLVTFEGQDKVGKANDYVNFTSNGVNFRITPASSKAITPLKNGSGDVIGQYDDSKAQVTYADGSYERF